ncbi:MAG: phosphate/phosphite/phosphonate ABC transporter substrate-binding protein [Nitrospiraceae bacterium]|nr:MAG: phosphate/phosphite/phosphonate ABC transporter substrate-binding protein [Nitrospiraceae bacterium]
MLIFLFLAVISNCKEASQKIDLGKKETLETVAGPSNGKPVRIAVGGMITPREGYAYYRKFLDYIEVKLGREVELVERDSYSEVNELLKMGEIDAAFVCGGPYVDGHKEFGMELLAAPVAYGEAVYYSYIIVKKDSRINSFEELRGKRFAFTDPQSNSGKLFPTYMLSKMNETPDTFFRTYVFTQSHDKSIKAVAQGIVDGAAVDSLIWEYADRTNPVFTSKTRTIMKSPPHGIPPVVVGPGLDPETKEALRTVFLNAHTDKEGREILRHMMIDRFIPIDDSAYDSIREMKEWIAGQDIEKGPGDLN